MCLAQTGQGGQDTFAKWDNRGGSPSSLHSPRASWRKMWLVSLTGGRDPLESLCSGSESGLVGSSSPAYLSRKLGVGDPQKGGHQLPGSAAGCLGRSHRTRGRGVPSEGQAYPRCFSLPLPHRQKLEDLGHAWALPTLWAVRPPPPRPHSAFATSGAWLEGIISPSSQKRKLRLPKMTSRVTGSVTGTPGLLSPRLGLQAPLQMTAGCTPHPASRDSTSLSGSPVRVPCL